MKFLGKRIGLIIDKMQEWSLFKSESLEGFTFIESEYTDNNIPPAHNAGWKPFVSGMRLSGKDNHYWFHSAFKTPNKEEGKELYFSLKTGKEEMWAATNPQCLVFLNGKITQALDTNHTEILLEYNTEYDMYMYFYMGMDGSDCEFHPSLQWMDKPVQQLYYDISVPYYAALCFKETEEPYITTLKELNCAILLLDLRELRSKNFYDSIDKAIEYLKENFYDGVCGKGNAVVNCIGHTHIDVAWLWTLAQTREKAQRSFATVINLMKQYPEYKFTSSQPQLYKYVKESAPELYEEIKQRVKEGRWEVEGAMWVEADCNLSSGESLVRQIIFGKRFMKQEFNADSKILWLPDVFGYSAAMPQILKKCGVNSFVTSKISWNESNKLPYDTFIWEGIDGTDIFTQFITTQDYIKGQEPDNCTTYCGYIKPEQVLGTWERYQQKEYNGETILTFGFGDGGGGPTQDMLEQQRRLAYGLPGMPKTNISFAGDFLDKVKENFITNGEKLRKLPRWVGELYLELHRGTYTSIAKNKRNNRKSEQLYQTLEGISSISMNLLNTDYPQNNINKSWETILLNQFHDIIPGSSIFEVYEDSDRQYNEILTLGKDLYNQMLDNIAANLNTKGGVLVYNPHSYICSDVVDYKGKKIFVENIPAFGWKVIDANVPEKSVFAAKDSIENKYYKVKFNKAGDIISIYDKENDRELVKQGLAANQFQIFEDYPYTYDAWDISPYYKDKMWTVDKLESVNIIDEGARAGLELTKLYGNSKFVQKIFLYNDGRRIDFETEADWHEDHVVLKAAFPFDIHANEATYEVQFGHVKRPTHSNTSWDEAKFEVCGQKWADISENGYGAALLNDCKYGYNTEGSTIKLTLLKSATYPNPQADRGHHKFTYSIYPHGDSIEEIICEAYNLNIPMVAKEVSENKGILKDTFSYLSCDNKNIIIETIKKAEDSDDIVIRLYEAANKRTNAALRFGIPVKNACLCDMLENDISSVKVSDNSINLQIKPFEIITLKIKN